jgi:hypothetical protein
MQKVALDQAASKYWTDYFKEYGQAWVRNIPRRIKQATTRHQKASSIEGEFAPIAGDVSPDGTLSIEAAFNGKIDNQNAKIMITASFNNEGKLKEFICNRIS